MGHVDQFDILAEACPTPLVKTGIVLGESIHIQRPRKRGRFLPGTLVIWAYRLTAGNTGMISLITPRDRAGNPGVGACLSLTPAYCVLMTDKEILDALNKLVWEGFALKMRVQLGSVAIRDNRSITWDDIPHFVEATAERGMYRDFPEVESEDSTSKKLREQLQELVDNSEREVRFAKGTGDTSREALTALIQDATGKDYI